MNIENMSSREIIRTYYQCFKEADKETLKQILAPEFLHVSKFATYSNRDKMIEEIWPAVGKTWAENLRIFGDGPEFIVRYEVVEKDRPTTTMAEYIRFEEEKIVEIEVFMGRELE